VDTQQLRVLVLVFAVRSDVLVPADAVRALGRAISADCITLQQSGHGIPLIPIRAGGYLDDRRVARHCGRIVRRCDECPDSARFTQARQCGY
jgi:hypothetical protein